MKLIIVNVKYHKDTLEKSKRYKNKCKNSFLFTKVDIHTNLFNFKTYIK